MKTHNMHRVCVRALSLSLPVSWRASFCTGALAVICFEQKANSSCVCSASGLWKSLHHAKNMLGRKLGEVAKKL